MNAERKTKNDMMYVDTNIMPTDLTLDNLEDYINVADTALNKMTQEPFELIFGNVISIQRAIDYAVNASLLPSHLMQRKYTPPRTSSKNHLYIPNFWAYVGYVIIERIRQSDELKMIYLQDKPLVNVSIKKTNTFKGTVSTITPNVADKMYTGIIRAVIDVIRRTKDLSNEEQVEALNALLFDLKKDKEKSVFAGMRFNAEYL